jgi:hypothetical protein
VTNNYSTKDVLATAGRIATLVSLMTSYPLVFNGFITNLMSILDCFPPRGGEGGRGGDDRRGAEANWRTAGDGGEAGQDGGVEGGEGGQEENAGEGAALPLVLFAAEVRGKLLKKLAEVQGKLLKCKGSCWRREAAGEEKLLEKLGVGADVGRAVRVRVESCCGVRGSLEHLSEVVWRWANRMRARDCRKDAITVLFVLTTLGIAFKVEDVGFIAELSGALVSGSIIWIFPVSRCAVT